MQAEVGGWRAGSIGEMWGDMSCGEGVVLSQPRISRRVAEWAELLGVLQCN